MSRVPRRPVVVFGAGNGLRALSRVVTLALRHEPEALGLALDEQGWVAVDTLLAALRSHDAQWNELDLAGLQALVDSTDKARHEIVDGRMRSLYGHSLVQGLVLPQAMPPARLFHGTAVAAATAIFIDGLMPKGRQFVHLSADRAWARAIAYRKSTQPALLQVRADEAHAAGVVFHNSGGHVWLSGAIDPRFIESLPAR
ncbi:MAG: RNA 2'-phosphotransferase [Arenimonas sp.]